MYYFIEPMSEEDIDDVQAVERTSFKTPWSDTTYRQELRNPAHSRYIVARCSPTPPPPREQPAQFSSHNGRLLQSLIARFLGTPPPPASSPLIGYGGVWIGVDEAHITTIAVHPSHRGHGIGELLLNGLIDSAFEMNAPTLTLEVRASNTIAQNLYLKYGFLPTGHRRRYYTDNREDAVIMTTIPITSTEYQDRLKQLRWHLFTRLRSYTADNQILSSFPSNGSTASGTTNPLPISPEVPTRVD